MNGNQLLWLGMSLAIAIVVVLLAVRAVRRQTPHPTKVVRSAWLVAATSSGTMLIFIAAKVCDLIPNATAVDVGALAVTGILTGFFLALAMQPASTTRLN